MLNRIIAVVTVLAGLLSAVPLPAAEFCATNSAELSQHLDTAEGNGEDDVIRIATGTYPASEKILFRYSGGLEDHDLTLIGGYTEFFGNPCGQVLTENPYLTVLDGGGEEKVMGVWLDNNSSLTVRGLTFRNGVQGGGPSVSGLQITLPTANGATYAGDISIEGNAFLSNQENHSTALNIFQENLVGSARIYVVNNVFTGNQANCCACAAASLTWSGGDTGLFGAGVFVTNNTVVGNNSSEDKAHAAFCISGEAPTIYVANNNFWGNGGGGLRVDAGPDTGYSLYNNNIDSRAGSQPTNMADNMAVDPAYQPCQNSPLYCLLYPSLVPKTGSRLVDAGRHPPQLFPQWYLTSSGLSGQLRVDDAGGRVDIGAFENNDRFFTDRFEQ